MAVGTRMQQRRATAAVWNTSNYVLAAGELGVTTDTGIIKIGDGVNTWSELDPAFDSEFLPLLGKAADSELLDGISASGFLQLGDATTAATADKIARRTSDGKLKAVAGTTTDDVVNYTQLTDSHKILDSRSVTADFTLQLTDVNKFVIVSNASYSPSIVCTLPLNSSVAIPVGSYVDILCASKGSVTFTPASGVTVNGVTLLYGGRSEARLVKTATDTWRVIDVAQSPGPVLRRRIKTGSDNTISSGVFTRVRLDGADSGTSLFSNNADTLGANEQWSSSDLYRCYCRRSGWYDITAQVSLLEASTARFFVQLRVNNIEQYLGSGVDTGGWAEIPARFSAKIPLNVGDYVEVWPYHEAGANRTVSDSPYASSAFEWAWRRPL